MGVSERVAEETAEQPREDAPVVPAPIARAGRGVLAFLEQDRVAVGLLALAMVIYAAVTTYLMRGTTVFVDEISMIKVADGLRPGSLLEPLNGHLIFVSRVLWGIDLQYLGAPYVLARIFVILGVITVSGLVFVLARPRIGAPAALAPAVLLLFFGTAWENVFVQSGIPPVYAMVGGVGALTVLDRFGARRDWAACLLLTVSVASWTAGPAFVLGATVVILLQRRGLKRLWVPAIPLALYGAWMVWMRRSYIPDHPLAQYVDYSNLLLIPNYIGAEIASVLSSLLGLNYPFGDKSPFTVFTTTSPFGAPLAIAGVALLVWRIRASRQPPVLWGALVAMLAFFALLGLGYSDARTPDTARFVHVGGVLTLVIAAVAAARVGVPKIRGPLLLTVYAVTALALVTNIARAKEGHELYRSYAMGIRAEDTAIEIARDVVDPKYTRQTSGLQFTDAGPYLEAVDRGGSPAYSIAELEAADEGLRGRADATLVQAERIAAVPTPATQALGPCRTLEGFSAVTVGDLGAPGVSIRVPTAGTVTLRRFADFTQATVGLIAANKRTTIALPRDRSDRPWALSVTPAPASITVCPLR